jgi:hypothetical protein
VLLAFVCFFTGVRAPGVVFVGGNLAFSVYVALYLVGLDRNLDDRGVSRVGRLPWYALQVILTPVFSLMEASAVLWGLFRPDRDFHVVTK